MDQNYQSRGYLLDNYRLFHLQGIPGTQIDAHYHEFCKLLMIRSGSSGYMVSGRKYYLKAGDMVLIGSHCIHRPEFDPAVPCERIILYLSPEFLRQQSAGDLDLLRCFSSENDPVLRLREGEQQKIFSLLGRLEQELSSKNYGWEVLSNGLLLQLLAETGQCLESRDVLHPDPILPENTRILNIIHYIDSHLSEDLSIDHLSEQFYISKYHMMRLFRQETGHSIHSYMTDRRLLLARELISGGMSATESCFRSGFRSYSSFSRAYNRRFGTTPTGRSPRLEESYE